jgi:hypothetical protein
LKNSPLIICGCHGGGTSFVTKALILNGLYCGDSSDRNPIQNRKTHENKSFHNLMEGFYKSINKKYKITDPKTNIDRNIDVIKTMMSQDWDDVQRSVNLDEVLLRYCGSAEKRDLHKFEEPWGWKNPRNAIFLPLWVRLFEKPKFLYVQKERAGYDKRSTSEGRGHARDFSQEFVDLHASPRGYNNLVDHKIVNFSRFINEVSHFNEIQKFAGLKELKESEYNDLMTRSGLER